MGPRYCWPIIRHQSGGVTPAGLHIHSEGDGIKLLQDMKKSRPSAASHSSKNVALSELDWAILDVLTRDPHASNREIAETLKIPGAQVASRIRSLDRRNLSHVLAALDLKAAGQSFCFILLDVNGRPLDEIAAEFQAIREVLMISALTGGPHDLLLIVRFKDFRALEQTILGRIYPTKGVYQTSVSIVLDVPIFRSQYVRYAEGFLPQDPQAISEDLALDYDENVLDKLDRNIIAELQVNGRQSINAIARKHGINASTIRYRINNLETRGLMRFITVLDPQAVGLSNFAHVEIQVEASKIPSVIASLRHKRWLPQLFVCTGPAAIMGIILADSISTLGRLKTEELRQIDGILGVSISALAHTYKADMRWGQRYTETLPHVGINTGA
jgi:Lrp/AsnC family transcriptional regulator for asnA, asnC and gidA